MRRLDEVLVVFEYEFQLSIRHCAVLDKFEDRVGNRNFGEAIEDGDDVVGFQSNRYSGVEGVSRQLVLVNEGGTVTEAINTVTRAAGAR